MTRAELERYIAETYNTDPDYPFEDSPEAAVFRHANNRKWFAIIMRVRRDRLGLSGEGEVDIVNLKCDQLMLGSMLIEQVPLDFRGPGRQRGGGEDTDIVGSEL